MRITAKDIECPAGLLVEETIQGPACRCRITQETITAHENPTSLEAFCVGKYIECPVWIREKKAIAADKARDLHREIKAVQKPAGRPAS